MEIFIIFNLIFLAFFCEILDSSLGMGYGTIISPVLIISGYNPLLVVPSILISQALAGFSASIFHQKYKNVNLYPEQKDTKISIIIISAGLIATFIAVLIAIQLPKDILKIYIGLLVIIMGLILLSKFRFKFSWSKISVIGILSGFNKALSGGGFGPVVTSGQLISGNGIKNSIGITTVTEAPICMFGVITYIFLNGFFEPILPIFLTIGALLATPIGPLVTMKLKDNNARKLIGLLILILGIFTIFKTIL